MFGDTMFRKGVFIGFILAVIIGMNFVTASSEAQPSGTDHLLITISDAQLNRYNWSYIYDLTYGARGYLITLDNESNKDNVNKFIDFASEHGKIVFVTYTEIYQNGTLKYKTYTVDPSKVYGVLVITNDPNHLNDVVSKMKSVGYKRIYVMYTYIHMKIPVYDNQTNSTTYKDYYNEPISIDSILNNKDINGVLLMAYSQDQNNVDNIVSKLKSKDKKIMVSVGIYVDPYTQQPIYDATGDVLKSTFSNDKYDWVTYSSFDSLVPSVLKYTMLVKGVPNESNVNYKYLSILLGLISIGLGFLYFNKPCGEQKKEEKKESKE